MISTKIHVVLSVLGVFHFQPLVEFIVMAFALLAAVGMGVVAQIKQAAPVVGLVRRRAMGSKCTENRDIAWLHLKKHAWPSIDDRRWQRVIVTIFRRQAPVAMHSWKDFGRSVFAATRINGDRRRRKRA